LVTHNFNLKKDNGDEVADLLYPQHFIFIRSVVQLVRGFVG